MRVLTITNMWPDEAEPWKGIFVARQMRSLSTLDINVDVVSIRGGGSALRSLTAYARAAVRILALNLAPRRYDLIHAHTGHCGLLACLQVRYPVVMSYVGYDLDITADRPDNARTIFERYLFRQLSRVLAATISKSLRGHQHLPEATRSRNTVIPNGVDRSLFAPMARTDAREQLGRPGDERPIALFPADPGRYNKRFELAQAAVEQARQDDADLRLEVVSGQPGEQVALWMSAADVLVMSSRAEGSPNVVKEAMSCDLPIVAVDVGDVREIIEGTRHCHVCEPEPEAMGRAITEVVGAIPERSDGRDRSEHLGLLPIAHRVRDVYRQAIERGPGPFGFVRRREPKRCVA